MKEPHARLAQGPGGKVGDRSATLYDKKTIITIRGKKQNKEQEKSTHYTQYNLFFILYKGTITL